MGGLRRIFLTHRDDVADAARYAQHFAAQRIIHSAELAAQPEAEIVLEGKDLVPFGLDFLVIPKHPDIHRDIVYCCISSVTSSAVTISGGNGHWAVGRLARLLLVFLVPTDGLHGRISPL